MECFRRILRRSLLIVILLGASYPLLLLAVGKIDPLTLGRFGVIFARTAQRPEFQSNDQETAREPAAETTETSAVVPVVLQASKGSEPAGFCQVLQQLANRSCLTGSGGKGGHCRIRANCSDALSDDASDFSPPATASEAMLPTSSGTRFVLFLRDPRDVLIAACDLPGAYTGCENLNLFLMQNIRRVSRSVDLRHRIFTSMKQSPGRAEVFFYEDFHRAATRSRLLADLAQFLGVSLAEPELLSLAEGGRKSAICMANSLLPNFLAASLTRAMTRELPSNLARRWQELCPPFWPKTCLRKLNRGQGLLGDSCGKHAQGCPDLCHRIHEPPFCASMSSGPGIPRPCRVESTGDWFQHVAPNLETRGVIHTYFVPPSKKTSKAKAQEVYTMLAAWRYAWERAGWTTRVLTFSDAQRSPDFEELKTLWSQLRPESESSESYSSELEGYFRYLAMASAGGGWMSEYDVIPTYLTADMEPANNGTFTVYQNEVPALMSGSKKEWLKVAKTMFQERLQHKDRESFSERQALEVLRFQTDRDRDFVFMNVVAEADTWRNLPMTHCQVMQQMTLALHFSDASIARAELKSKNRSKLMMKAADRWWACQSPQSTGVISSKSKLPLGELTEADPALPGAGEGRVNFLPLRAEVNASFRLVLPPEAGAAPAGAAGAGGDLGVACTVLNQLAKLRCFSKLNCSSDVTCGTDAMYIDNVSDGSCKDVWPPVRNATDMREEARLFLHAGQSAQVLVFLRDPRDIVISAFRRAKTNPNCPTMELFALRHIQAVSRWVNMRHEFVMRVREIDDTRAQVFFSDDLYSNLTSAVRSMALFVGVRGEREVSASMLQSLVDVGMSSGPNTTARHRCLSSSAVSEHVGAAMTRLMKRELSQTLWERWRNCKQTWPKVPTCPKGSQLAVRSQREGSEDSGDYCSGPKGRSCPSLCKVRREGFGCLEPSVRESPKPCVASRIPEFWSPASGSKQRPLKVMHTYYTNEDDPSDKATNTLGAWQEAWRRAGWETRILTIEDAKTSANFSQVERDLLTKVPLGNNPRYDYHCYMRYLAMAEAGGGWMSDYDVIPTWLTPDTDLPNNGSFTIYQNHVPALLSGTQEEWYRMTHALVSVAVEQGEEHAILAQGKKLFSDMIAMLVLRSVVPQPLLYVNVIANGNEWGPDVREVDCGTVQRFTLAVHFSHRALSELHRNLGSRGRTMTEASERFWKCAAEASRSFASNGHAILNGLNLSDRLGVGRQNEKERSQGSPLWLVLVLSSRGPLPMQQLRVRLQH